MRMNEEVEGKCGDEERPPQGPMEYQHSRARERKLRKRDQRQAGGAQGD